MKFQIADSITIANVFVGILAVMYILDGACRIASALILIAILLDGIDGKVARAQRKKHEFGRYIDSVSDSISFCLAPAVLLYKSYYVLERGSAFYDFQNAIVVLVIALIVLFGMLRLARFAYRKEDEMNYFIGLPTPAFALLTVVLYSLFNTIWILPLISISSLLMISPFRYPKMESKLYAISGVVAVLFSLLAIVYNNLLGIASLILIGLYIFVAPVYYILHNRKFFG